jgi:hypothetical protein
MSNEEERLSFLMLIADCTLLIAHCSLLIAHCCYCCYCFGLRS